MRIQSPTKRILQRDKKTVTQTRKKEKSAYVEEVERKTTGNIRRRESTENPVAKEKDYT